MNILVICSVLIKAKHYNYWKNNYDFIQILYGKQDYSSFYVTMQITFLLAALPNGILTLIPLKCIHEKLYYDISNRDSTVYLLSNEVLHNTWTTRGLVPRLRAHFVTTKKVVHIDGCFVL